MPLTRRQLEAFELRLSMILARLRGDINQLSAHSLELGASREGFDGDTGPLLADEELTFQLLGRDYEAVAEVTEALERITDGTFGTCQRCRDEVPRRRLQAIPHARYCVGCASEVDRGHERRAV